MPIGERVPFGQMSRWTVGWIRFIAMSKGRTRGRKKITKNGNLLMKNEICEIRLGEIRLDIQ